MTKPLFYNKNEEDYPFCMRYSTKEEAILGHEVIAKLYSAKTD